MSDSRRRRKAHHSGDSDDHSDSYDELNATKETLNSTAVENHPDSEYDTAGSDSETESQEGVLRESGDGQEEEKSQRKLDDDEDRRNPQYIPKRGTFYEHDDRTAEEVTESTVEPQVERETKEKKVWKDKEDKWNHDRYNDAEQAPKSHEELIAVYGYDIRNEEGPPRARRRRRYGRGPNKYTRNWEDEDAYGKVAGSTSNKTPGKKSNRSSEEFPALGNSNKDSPKPEEPVISSAWFSNKTKLQNKANFPALQTQQDGNKSKQSNLPVSQLNEKKISNESTNQAWKKDSKSVSCIESPNGNTGGGDADTSVNLKALPRDNNKRNVQESVSLAASRVRGRGFKANTNNNVVSNRGNELKPKGRGPGPIISDNRRLKIAHSDEEHKLANDLKHMDIVESTSYHATGRQNKNFHTQSNSQQRSNTVPPRLQQSHPQHQQSTHQQVQQPQPSTPQDAAGNRPKRYSSLRQRPTIAEGPSQQNYQAPHGQHTFYSPQAGSSRAVLESQGYPQGPFEQTPPVAPPTAPLAGQAVIPLPSAPQPPGYAPPPPFLVPPPQFMPPQTAPPNILNYVSGPSGPAFQPNYQGYQGYNPAAVQPQGPPTPQELFQPQGCTYYSPAQQQQQQQPVRRPKAAIPILPPPDSQQQYQAVRNRGKNSPQQHHQQEIQHQQLELQQQYQQVLQEQQHALQEQHVFQQQQHQQVFQQHHQQELQQQQLELQQLKLQQEMEQRQGIHQQQNVQHQQEVYQQELHQHQTEMQQSEKLHQHEQNMQEHLESHEYPFEKQQEKIQQPQEIREQGQEIQPQKIDSKKSEQLIQQTQQEMQQEPLQNLGSSQPVSLQKIEVEEKIQPVEKSLNLNVETYKISSNEQLQNTNVHTDEVKKVPKVEKDLIVSTENSLNTPAIVDSVSDAPVKCNAPVVDEIVPLSVENVVKKEEADGAVLESPIVEKTAA